MLVLGLVGTAALSHVIPIALAVALLLATVVVSYRQTVRAYSGGGAYIVAHENLGTYPGLLAAAALLIDYVLTVSVSITAGVDATISAAPTLAASKVPSIASSVLWHAESDAARSVDEATQGLRLLMAGGRVRALADLPEPVRTLFERERRGVLTSLDPDGRGHSVPVVFVVIGDEIVSPIDHKPKSGRKLQRLSNIERDDRVTLLVDHWDEDWTRLAWVMVRAHAVVDAGVPPEVATALNARYPQYAPDKRPDALIRMRPTELTWWTWE